MQPASTQRCFGKSAAFFFHCQTFSYKLKAPKPNYTGDTAYQVPVLGRNHSSVWTLPLQAEHTFLISTFCNSSIPPWEILGKIFITITQYKLINRERTENYLVGSKKQADFCSVSKHLTLQFGMFMYKEGHFRQNTEIRRVCFVTVRPARSHRPWLSVLLFHQLEIPGHLFHGDAGRCQLVPGST